MPFKVANTRYSLVKGERIVRFVFTTRLRREKYIIAPFLICTFWLRVFLGAPGPCSSATHGQHLRTPVASYSDFPIVRTFLSYLCDFCYNLGSRKECIQSYWYLELYIVENGQSLSIKKKHMSCA
ncbi:hypothetical protein ACOSP7_020569 [Xanthoceras sorbifolium]